MSPRAFVVALVVVLLSLAVRASPALPYEEADGRRFRFAQTYVAADLLAVAPVGRAAGIDERIGGLLVPRLAIGALHFWGHADAYVSFPLGIGKDGGSGELRYRHSTGVETGVRVFPWRIASGALRAFAGVAWTVAGYEQQVGDGERGPALHRHRFPLQLGLVYATPVGLAEAGVQWYPGARLDYATSRNATASMELPALSGWLGFKYVFDATVNAEEREASGGTARRLERFRTFGLLSHLSLAIGGSSAWALTPSPLLADERPFLQNPAAIVAFPEFGAGAWIEPLDASVNVVHRAIDQEQSAYGFTHATHRRSIGIEAIKFLADFHGFVPFVGAGVGHEWLAVRESDRGAQDTDVRATRWAPYLVVGWDIRPTAAEWFLLRTNLRYTPGLGVDTPEGRVVLDHLEFNFIEFVFFPARLVAVLQEG